MDNIRTSESGERLHFKPNTFVLGSYQDFLQQEARYFLQNMSLNRELRNALGVTRSTSELSGTALSHVVAHSLNKKSNPMHLVNQASNFTNAKYYFYREVSDQIDNESAMYKRFQDVAIQSISHVDYANLGGIKDFMPKTVNDERHMHARIIRDMNNEIGRQTMGVTIGYLLENNSGIHTPEAIEHFVQKSVVSPYKQNLEFQRDLAHKVVGVMDLKESVLKSFCNPEFLERYGDAIAMDAFNIQANVRVYQDATTHGIAIPRAFNELQTGLKHFEASGVGFEGYDRVKFPPDHRHMSTICTREGFDINNLELRELAQEFKDAVFEQTLKSNPFDQAPATKVQKQPENLGQVLEQLKDIDSPSL